MNRQKRSSLRDEIEGLGPDRFWRDGQVGGPPDYRRVLYEVLMSRYPNGVMRVADVLTDDHPHPSTFQRDVASEAKRRRDERTA